MKFKNFFNSDSPMQDRMLRISNEDDLDDDLSGGGAGGESGLSLEDEEEAEEDFSGNEDEEGDVGESDGDSEEDGIDYKQRYADTKTDRDRILSEQNQSKEEIGRLKSELAAFNKSDESDEELERQYGDELHESVSQISQDDPDRAKKVYAVIGKHNARMRKSILDEIDKRNATKTRNADQEARRREGGVELAKIALKEVGLDADKTFNLFQKEVDDQMNSEPKWFTAIPDDQQFIRLANRVLKKVESNKQKNAEHRKGAGGMLSSGSKVKKQSDSQDEDDGPSTMIGAMGAVRQSQRNKAKKRAEMVGR